MSAPSQPSPLAVPIGATDVGPIDVEDLGHGPVGLGGILFTMVDPHRGHEVAYNRWYERDHLIAGCTVGPYCFAAKRWVAPRAYKQLRHLEPGNPVSDDRMQGGYLALYWLLAGHVGDWNRWAFREFRWLHEQGRMFPHRDHVHTLLYDHDGVVHRDTDPVPVSLALDHPFAGLAVIVGEAEDREAFDAWSSEQHLPGLLADSPVNMVLSFTGIPLEVDAQDVAADDAASSRFLHLAFLDEDPLTCWDQTISTIPATVAASGLGKVTWAGPFIPTVPGTDRYTDQLW